MWRWLMLGVLLIGLSEHGYELGLAIIGGDKNLTLISLFWIAVFGWVLWLYYFHSESKKEMLWQKLVTAIVVNVLTIWIGFSIAQSAWKYFSNDQTVIGVLLLIVVLVFAVLAFVCLGRFKSYVVSGKDD